MRVTILAGRGSSTNILVNYLRSNLSSEINVVTEDSPTRLSILKYRARVLGLPVAIGQMFFMILAAPLLRWTATARRDAIRREYGLDDSAPLGVNISQVDTINATAALRELDRHRPDIVIVNGTRIIKQSILDRASCPFINTHAGITPQYRGVHGGYWALWNRDCQNFGVTLHLVDSGVDTGTILDQVRVSPTPADNFATYPLLQQAVSLPRLVELLRDFEARGSFETTPTACNENSKQWFHPTIWQYVAGRLRGVS